MSKDLARKTSQGRIYYCACHYLFFFLKKKKKISFKRLAQISFYLFIFYLFKKNKGFELTSSDNGLPSVTVMQHQRLSNAFLSQPANGISVC